MSSRSRGSKTWLLAMIPLVFLCRETQQIVKNFVNSSTPHLRPTFVVNFDTSTVICQHSSDPTDLHIHNMSSLCDGKQDCFVNPAMHDEVFPYCEHKCDSTCSGNGACLYDGAKPQCYCDSGFSGSACELRDKNECLEHPCHLMAQCQNTLGSYECRCLPGYQGTGHECSDIDECADKLAFRCPDHSQCINLPGTYYCNCTQGFNPKGNQGSGLDKCVDINECETGAHDCLASELCENTIGSFKCVSKCSPGYEFLAGKCEDVDECASKSLNKCDIRAECINTIGGYECECEEGFDGDGKNCQPKSSCRKNPTICDRHAHCHIVLDICDCKTGYAGDGITCHDINECDAKETPCAGGGRCLNLDGGYVCCKDGQDDGECIKDQGAFCSGGCGDNAICSNSTCECVSGFRGDPQKKCVDINECEENDSICGGVGDRCVNLFGGFKCCQHGTKDPECSTDQAFSSDSSTISSHGADFTTTGEQIIEGSGSIQTSSGGTITVTRGLIPKDVELTTSGKLACTSYCPANSECVAGYCECVKGYGGNALVGCEDIDECITETCNEEENEWCVNLIGGFVCCNPTNATQDDCLGLEITREKGMHLIGGNEEDTVVATRSNHSTSDQLITQVVQQSRNFSSGQIILTRGKVNSGEAVTQTSDADEFGLEISALDLAGSGSGVGIIKSTTTLTPVKEMPTGVWTEEEDGEDEDLMEEGSGSNSWSTTINGTGFTGAPRSEGTIRVRITTLGEDGETETATKPGVSVPLTTTVSGEGSGETSTVPAKSSGVSESVKASGESGSSSSGSSATSGESSGSSGNVTSAGKSEVGTPSSSAEESGSSGTSTSSREGSGESVSLGSTNSTSSGGGSESGNVTSTEESGSSGSSSSGSSESSGSTSTGTSTSGSTTSSQSVSSGSSVAPEEGSGTSESTTLPGEKPGSPESKEENLAVNKKNEEATSSGSVKVSKTEIEGSGSGEWFESGSKGHFESGTKVTVTSSEKSPEEPESSGKPKKPKTDKDQPDITTDGEDSSSSTAGGEKRPKGDSHSEKPKTDDKDHEHGKGKGDEDKEISKGNITTSSGGKNTTLEHGKTKVPAEKPTSSEIGLEISAGHKNEPDTSKETGLEIVWESTTTTPDPDNVGLEISGTDLAKSTKQPIEGSGTGDEEITATTRDVSKSTKRPRVAIDGGDNEESEGIDGLGGKPKTTAKPTPIETSSASPAGSGELPEGSGESAVSTTTPKESTTSVSGVEGSGETSTSSSSSVTESTLSSGVSEVTTSSESTLAPEGSGETPTPQPATISPQSREEPKPTKETFALPTTTTTQAPANKTIENTKCTSSDECGMDALCERRTGVCRCEPGFEGAPPKQACVDVDECATGDHKCHETARCQNFIGGYACFCPTGFRKTDDGSCEDIDECTEHNSTCCGANAKCVNKPGTYSCECEHGFLGDGYHCVPNTKKPCDSEQSVKSHCAESNMSCEVDTKDGAVECKECMGGYKKSGKMCEDINECDASESPCSSNAHCTNLNGTFSCSCKPGFRGDGFQCTDINECDERHPCHPHAECTNLEGSFKCECHSGFEGDGVKKCTNPLERSCEDVEKFCGRVEHVSCLSVRVYNGSLSSVCECEPGFRFDKENNKCVDIDECDENRNNCDPASAVCVNTEGSFRCECAEGYEGEGGVCTDIDECDRGMAGCDSMAMCINRMGSCGCKCMSGYTGDGVHCTKIEEPKSEKSTCTDEWSRLCELEKKQCTVDEEEVPQCGACLPGHHPINGTCQSLQISGLCVQKNDCNKHAVCIDILPDSHFCSCPDGFIGDGMMCDDVDECNNAGMCEDKNSQCENTIGSFNCVCDPGYKKEGDVCVAEKKAPNREKIEIDEETSSSTSSGAEKPTTQSSVATESTSTTVVTEAATKSSENGTSSETTTSSSSTEKLESSTSPESSTVLSKTSESTTTKVPSSGEPVSVSSTVPSKPVPSTSSGKSESTSLLPESTTQSVTLSSSTTENAIASSEAPDTTKKLSESKTTSSSKSSPESSTVSSISPETTTKESETTASGAPGSSTTLTTPTKPVTESTGSPTTTKAPEASTKSLEVDTSSSEATVATSTTSATTTKSSKESSTTTTTITTTPASSTTSVPQAKVTSTTTSEPTASSESPTTKPSTSPLPPSSVTTTTTKPIIEHRGPPSIQPPPELFTTTSSEAPVPSNGGYGEETNQEEEEEKATTTTEIPSLCSNITCHSLATCEPSSGTCICRDGFIGDGTTGCSKKSSADCVSLPSLCAENARCDNATKSCECEPGYIGDGYVCSPHPQDCILRQNLCSPEAICQNRRCQCLPGFTGDGVKCVSIHERASNCSQCDQNAHCVGGETCKCNNGYFGNGLCCVPDPLDCVHFTGICHPNAECNQESRQCECSSGFSGNGVSCFPQKSCRTDKSVCAKNAICLPTGHCICRHGFKGDPFYKCNSIILKEPQSLDLSDVTSCAVPCDPTSQLCISGECVCKKGFRLNSTLSTSSDQCVDVDECAERTHNCDRVATCHNTIGSHVCTCPDGHIGDGTTCVPHVNKGKLSVYCEADGMTLVLGNETSEFEGKIFVKGQAENPHCSKSFSSLLNSHKPYVFKVAFQHCDVQLLENHTMASTVVVQKHAMFLTNKADSYDLRCQYPIGSRAVESHVNVSELATTSTLTDKNSTLAPICRLSVSNDQQLSISSATVGDTLKLALEVTPSDNFGILPRNCFAVNIESGERYTLTDDHGCAIDESLFPQWSVASTSKVQAVFRTFKWPDSSMIRFQCDCVPCIGQCSVPSCISSARFRRHQTNHPIVSDDIRQELILMSGVESLAVSSIINVHDTNDNSEDTHVAPSHFQDSTSICVKMAPLFVAIASFAVFSVIMLYLCSKKPKTIKEGSEIGY